MMNATLRDFLENANSDYIHNNRVSEHWLDEPAPTAGLQYFLAFVYFVICIPSQICQILVFIAFFRSRHMRTPTNKLLISLTLADFLLLFMCHSLTIQNVTGSGPFLGTIGCDIYGTVASIAALAEIWSLALISIDRFQAIFHPLENEKRMKTAEVHKYLLIVWLMSIIFSVCPLLGWNRYTAEAYILGCSFDSFAPTWEARSYIIVLIILAWILPITVVGFCYSQIIHSVSKNLFYLSAINPQTSEIEKARKIEVSLAKMVAIILTVWVFAWTPYVILSGWIMFFRAQNLSSQLAILPTICCKLSASANSLIYGVRLPKFKDEIYIMASNLWKKVSTPDNMSNARTPSNPSNRMKVSDSINEDDDKHSMAVVIKWEASLQSNSRRNSSICSKSFGHLKSQDKNAKAKVSLIIKSGSQKSHHKAATVLNEVWNSNSTEILTNCRKTNNEEPILLEEKKFIEGSMV